MSNLNDQACTICGTEIERHYCPNCGQKYDAKKLTSIGLLSDLLVNLFSLEKSVFATCIRLIIDPKKIVKNYFDGFRHYYPSPGKILFYAVTVAGLHITFVDKTLVGLTFDTDNISAQVSFLLFFIPALSLCSLLGMPRLKIGFPEHMISSIYLCSSTLISLTILNDFLYLITGFDTDIYPAFLFLLLVFIGDARVFTPNPTRLRIARNTLFQFLAFCAFVSAILLLVFIQNPESIRIN